MPSPNETQEYAGGIIIKSKYNNKKIKWLLHEVQKNNVEAFTELYSYLASFVYSVSLSYLRNVEDAHDNVQNVFIRLFDLPKDSLPDKNEINWVYTITKNMAISYQRKNKKEFLTGELFETNILSTEDVSIFEWLDILDDEEVRIVMLKIVNRCTHKEISELFNIPQGTVQWKYSEAIKKIKKVWNDNDHI